MDATELLDEGKINQLVQSGRTPLLFNASIPHGCTYAVIPPEGVEAGNRWVTHPTGVYEFQSEGGVSRGLGKLVFLNSRQTEYFKTQMDQALQNLPNSR